MKNSRGAFALIGGFGLGAAAMYILDPDRGRRRRAVAADRIASSINQLGDATDVATRDLLNRARGVAAETWGLFHDHHVPDVVLQERVRSKLGRVSSHPAALDVAVEHGTVTLRGAVLEADVERVIAGVAAVRGVLNVRNELNVHRSPEGNPDLQGSGRPGERFALLQENWAPAYRLLAACTGTYLAVQGLRRHSMAGKLLSMSGLALLGRAATNMEFARLLGRKGNRTIDLQKTIHVHAPVEEVFTFWQKLENFPRIMSHVYNVEPIGDGRYRWTIAGPAGLPLTWNSVVTVDIPHRVFGWRSEPGSIVRNAGIVRFDTENGETRVHVRMSYCPPAGAIGHAVALLFGSDPKRVLDDDLARFKSVIEIGKTRAHGKSVTKETLAG